MANDEHLHKAFNFFDQNQSGYIEIDELREALNDELDNTSSEEVIAAIMQDVDTDKVKLSESFQTRDILDFSTHFDILFRVIRMDE